MPTHYEEPQRVGSGPDRSERWAPYDGAVAHRWPFSDPVRHTSHMAHDLPAGIRIIRGANRTLGRVAPSLASRLSRRIFSMPRKFTPREWELPFEATARRERLPSGLSVLRAGDGPAVALTGDVA